MEWQVSPPKPILKEQQVHIWRSSLLLSDEKVMDLSALLSKDEIARARRFVFEKDSNAFIIARAMLRKLLSFYLDCPPQAINFHYTAYGKPELFARDNSKNLFFNLSHAYDYAVFAFTFHRAIGIDIEYNIRKCNYADLAKRYFSTNEYQKLLSTPAGMQRQAFFNTWTRKEAFIKAVGQGLSYPLNQFEVALVPGEPVEFISIKNSIEQAQNWDLIDFSVAENYTAAIVIENKANEKLWCVYYDMPEHEKVE